MTPASAPTEPVIHWRDFVCPFCYVGQSRSGLLREAGLVVVDLPFFIHPDVPASGIPGPPGDTQRVAFLRQQAADAGLPLIWPARIPNTRIALSMAEWVRRHRSESSLGLDARIFAAHFAEGLDIGDSATLLDIAEAAGVRRSDLELAVATGEAETEMRESHRLGEQAGVTGTPAWLIGGDLVQGLQPVMTFVRAVGLTEAAMSSGTRGPVDSPR